MLPLLMLAGGWAGAFDDPVAAPPAPRYETRAVHDRDGIGKFYCGREIAQVMGHQAAEWLERPERETEEKPKLLLDALRLKPGDVVADIGAGSGYHAFPMAERVGPTGTVYAVDIQPEMLALVEAKKKQRPAANVKTVLGAEADPKLPDASCDLILMVDVYHEFNFPYEMTAGMVKALKPGGRLVFVEFRLEDAKVPIKTLHKMSERQVKLEMAGHPLEWKTTLDSLPWQHVVIFEKPKPRPAAKGGTP
jgi:ubiquinone/menaquinone biosynthesis C-methylase UbiE